jgi:hypothetical protein
MSYYYYYYLDCRRSNVAAGPSEWLGLQDRPLAWCIGHHQLNIRL